MNHAIKQLIKQMTVEEKAGLCGGGDLLYLRNMDSLGVLCIMVRDGPWGLRKQKDPGGHLEHKYGIKAVCFPAVCAADSFSLLGETAASCIKETGASLRHFVAGSEDILTMIFMYTDKRIRAIFDHDAHHSLNAEIEKTTVY
jgi:hypothetical protein